MTIGAEDSRGGVAFAVAVGLGVAGGDAEGFGVDAGTGVPGGASSGVADGAGRASVGGAGFAVARGCGVGSGVFAGAGVRSGTTTSSSGVALGTGLGVGVGEGRFAGVGFGLGVAEARGTGRISSRARRNNSRFCSSVISDRTPDMQSSTARMTMEAAVKRVRTVREAIRRSPGIKPDRCNRSRER
jgi:hypothetical protein